MKWFVISITTLFCLNCYSNSENRDRAISSIQKAVLAYPTVKKYKKNLEKRVYRMIPADKEVIGTIGSAAKVAIDGKIDTNVIKKMDVKLGEGRVRPNVIYDFKENSLAGSLNYSLSW